MQAITDLSSEAQLAFGIVATLALQVVLFFVAVRWWKKTGVL